MKQATFCAHISTTLMLKFFDDSSLRCLQEFLWRLQVGLPRAGQPATATEEMRAACAKKLAHRVNKSDSMLSSGIVVTSCDKMDCIV